MLFIFIMMAIIRLWMINAPKYSRKCERFPLNEDLTRFILSSMDPKPKEPKGIVYGNKGASLPRGYHPKGPAPAYGYSASGYTPQPPGYGYGPPRDQGYKNQGYTPTVSS